MDSSSRSRSGKDGVASKRSKRASKAEGRRTLSRATSDSEKPLTLELSTINGMRVVTPDGKADSKRGAQGYVCGTKIKKVKIFEQLRSEGVSEIEELAASIRAGGIIEPLVVRPANDGKTFELIAGHRRLHAARAIGGSAWKQLPVIIRSDLIGEDDRAIALAVAENSPDGRSNLNLVDIGRQASRLKAAGWSAERMASGMGLHVKHVRRALSLIEMPLAIQEKVRTGEIGASVASELSMLPPTMRRELEDKVGVATTASEIRLLRKRLERAATEKRAERGLDIRPPLKGKSGKQRTPERRLTTAWKRPTDMNGENRQLAISLHNYPEDEVGTAEFHEVRGALGVLLWCRGDLEYAMLPSVHEEEMDDIESGTKGNDFFNKIVANEASRGV